MKEYKSKRHHYIPQFLIKGFTNVDGYVYVYDKEKDVISSKPRSPKSIFFEYHRNSVSNFPGDNDFNSVIEDELFKYVDDETSKPIIKLQNNPVKDIDLDEDVQAMFQFFIIHLFWRIPYTDYGFKTAYVDGLPNGINKKEYLRLTESNKFKLERSKMFNHTFAEMQKNKPISPNFYFKITEFGEDHFVLGDNPLLFKDVPKLYSDIGYMDLITPISSRRMVSRTEKQIINFSRKETVLYNCFTIELSKRYIVSGNLKLLQDSVNLYKAFKPIIVLIPYDNMLFKMLYGNEDSLVRRYLDAF